MKPPSSVSSAAVALALGAMPFAALAQSAEPANADARTLEEVTVLAVPEDQDRIATPYGMVEGDEVVERDASTLGEALGKVPGVRMDGFGAGASRPVIRGQTAPRVKVLSNGASVLDASDISPDHAVTVDPLLIDRIEVLRGPATLMYGGGAASGVVNVIDGKVPTSLPENGLEGRITLRANTVARERAAAAAVDKQIGANLVLHAEGSWRDADNYRAPRFGRIDNTFADSKNGALGLSWVTPDGYIGLAYSDRRDDYGLPGHSHEYESCHPHGSSLHCGGHGDDHDHDHDHDHGSDHGANTVLKSRRLDLRGEYRAPFAGISRIRFRGASTDYRHHEMDGGVIGSTFADKGYEWRIAVQHVPIGRWQGVIGLQHAGVSSSTAGVEAFLPKVDSRETGLFLIEHFRLDERWHFEVGARHDRARHQAVDDSRHRPTFDSTAISLSGAATWTFRPGWALRFTATRSQRLPHPQELYARGIHLATNTYECGMLPSALTCGDAAGDTPLRKETGRHFGVSLRKTAGDLSFNIGAFVNTIDNYISARTLDQFEDFRLVKYSQRDARFRGLEAEASLRMTRNWSASVFGDYVRATFAGGGNVPRIPAARYGGRVNYTQGRCAGAVELHQVVRQKDIARFESKTPGHTMLEMSLVCWLPGSERTQLFLRGSNLLDRQVWNHASHLANTVPLPGRGLMVGMTHRF